MTTQVTAQQFNLAQEVLSGNVYLTLDFEFETAPLFTEGKIKVNRGEQSEWFVIEDLALVSGETTIYRADVVTRGLKKDATNVLDSSTTLQKDHNQTTVCEFVTHSLDWNGKAGQTDNNTFLGDNIITGSLSFTGTTEAGLAPQQVTTAQRNALTDVDTGQYLYNTTTSTGQYNKNDNSWGDIPTGATNANASETVSGKSELTTVAEQITGAGGTTDPALALQARYLLASASGTKSNDSGRITIFDSTGKIKYPFMPTKGQKFGGTGEDGALTGGLTITGSNNSYIVKNYTSIANGSFTMEVTPTNCIIHIKVLGDANLTNWTFNLAGKGGQGGSAGGTPTVTSPNNGTTGSSGSLGSTTATTFVTSPTGGGGGNSGSGGAAGVAVAVTYPYSTSLGQYARYCIAGCGAGGGGGGGGYNVDRSGDANPQPPYIFNGGAGGNGGGCLILEVAGTLTFSSTTVNISGTNGGTGSNGTNVPYVHPSGGGGGGAGGTFLYMYNAISGSPTVTTTAGSGGSGGSAASNGGYSGGGGAGGSNIFTAGSNGTAGGNNAAGGNGGNGAAGTSYGVQNTLFS